MEIQEVVDGLATSLRRSVLVNDRAYRPVAKSARHVAADEPVLSRMLDGPSRATAQGFLDRIGVLHARRPMKVKWAPLGAAEQLAVPIRTPEEPLGTLWLCTGGLPALTSDDYSSIDAAVAITRDLLAPRTPSAKAWGATDPADLLAHDPGARRQAFAGAVAERWLRRGGSTVVWAVDVRLASGIDRTAYGSHFTVNRTPGVVFIADHEGMLVFVSAEEVEPAVESRLREEGDRRGVVIQAIGSARHQRDDDDLQGAADRACMAARLVPQVPDAPATADIGQLGPWLMLSSIVADRAQLALFSPAAVALWTAADQVQRETVETYLDVCGQARDACALLFIHRTTLYYRLEHLPQVVRDALADGMARGTLHLCLKLIRYWEATGRL